MGSKYLLQRTELTQISNLYSFPLVKESSDYYSAELEDTTANIP